MEGHPALFIRDAFPIRRECRRASIACPLLFGRLTALYPTVLRRSEAGAITCQKVPSPRRRSHLIPSLNTGGFDDVQRKTIGRARRFDCGGYLILWQDRQFAS